MYPVNGSTTLAQLCMASYVHADSRELQSLTASSSYMNMIDE